MSMAIPIRSTEVTRRFEERARNVLRVTKWARQFEAVTGHAPIPSPLQILHKEIRK